MIELLQIARDVIETGVMIAVVGGLALCAIKADTIAEAIACEIWTIGSIGRNMRTPLSVIT